ncbi:MAG: DMT family transporter [Elusimicrobia bacterium]|nr:DMT family transporter [Elusimicrobiota bacterium]
MNTNTLIPRLAAFGAVILWGVSFVATKAVLQEASPVTIIFSRFTLGVITLIFILRIRGEPLLPPRDTWPALTFMGFVGIFVHQILQIHGLTLTTAIRTGWLIGLIPIWSALLSALVLTRGELSWSVLTLPTTRGDLLILASTVNWAVYTVLGHSTLKRLGSVRTTTAVMFLGWLMLLPLFVAGAGWRDYSALSGVGTGSILFLGVGCSGLGYLFWYTALERIEASKVAAFLYLEPFITFIAAVTLLHEPVIVTIILGGLLVLAGVFAVQHAPARESVQFNPAMQRTSEDLPENFFYE